MAWVSFYKANATAYSLAAIHHHPFPFDTRRRWTRDLSNSGYPSLTTATPFNARALGSNLLLQNLFVDIRGERVTKITVFFQVIMYPFQILSKYLCIVIPAVTIHDQCPTRTCKAGPSPCWCIWDWDDWQVLQGLRLIIFMLSSHDS